MIFCEVLSQLYLWIFSNLLMHFSCWTMVLFLFLWALSASYKSLVSFVSFGLLSHGDTLRHHMILGFRFTLK